jgi:hypothetical protein
VLWLASELDAGDVLPAPSIAQVAILSMPQQPQSAGDDGARQMRLTRLAAGR